MSGAKKNFIGLEGFIWWVGVVEDRQDPEQLGRVRVRCFGWHTENKELIPTDALPWAHPVLPVNNPNMYTPKEGDFVFGFFMDGANAQNPAIVGVLPGKPAAKPNYQKGFSDPRTDFGSAPKKPDDQAENYPKAKYLNEASTNRLSRGKTDSTVIATRKTNRKTGITSAAGVSWEEPNPAYAAQYPYNNALESESGHALEFDDTPNKERIHLAHRNGSFVEFDVSGDRVERIQKDRYSITMGSDYVYINGKCSVTIEGDYNLKVGGNMNIEVDGAINMSAGNDIRIKGKKYFVESTSDMNLLSAGVGNFTSVGKMSVKGGNVAIQGAIIDLPAGRINMQSGSATTASGAGLSGGGADPTSADAAAAANSNQEIVDTNAETVTPNVTVEKPSKLAIAGKVIGKSIADGVSTVSNVFAKINGAADGLIKELKSPVPLGELSAKVSSFKDNLTENKGEILSLKPDLQNTIKGKVSEVKGLAEDKNIDFDVDQELLPKNIIANTKKILAKKLFPKTETVDKGDT